MFKRKKKEIMPAARAGRAQMNIFVRLVGSGLLIYVMYNLIRAEELAGSFWKIAVVVIMGLLSATIIVITVIEFIKNIKNGLYGPSYYDKLAAEEKLAEEEDFEENIDENNQNPN